MVAFSDFCLKRFKANLNLRYNKKISENISALIELTSEYDFQISHLSQILFRQKIKNQPVCKRWQIYMVLHFFIFQFEMVVLKVFREFAGGTSIHGFTFLVRPKSSSWTKTMWAISLAVALMYATLEMRNSVVGKTD